MLVGIVIIKQNMQTAVVETRSQLVMSVRFPHDDVIFASTSHTKGEAATKEGVAGAGGGDVSAPSPHHATGTSCGRADFPPTGCPKAARLNGANDAERRGTMCSFCDTLLGLSAMLYPGTPVSATPLYYRLHTTTTTLASVQHDA